MVHIINIGFLAPHDLIYVAKLKQMQGKFDIPEAIIVRICLPLTLTKPN